MSEPYFQIRSIQYHYYLKENSRFIITQRRNRGLNTFHIYTFDPQIRSSREWNYHQNITIPQIKCFVPVRRNLFQQKIVAWIMLLVRNSNIRAAKLS